MALSVPARQRGLFLILCVVWGINWIAMKTGATHVPPALFSGLRWTAAGVLLLAFRAARRQPVLVSLLVGGRILWLAALMITFNAGLTLYSLRVVGSGLAAVLNCAITPIALLGFSVAFGQERFNRRQLYALALGVGGVLLLFGPAALAGRLDGRELLGAAGILASTLAYCLASVMSRPLMRTLPPAQMVALTNLLGGVMLLTLSLLFEPGSWHALRLNWGWAVWASWLYLLLAGSLGATIIYFFLVRDWGASRTGTYAFVSPVIAVIAGMLVFGEQVHATDAAGMALMLCAAGVVLRKT